MADAVASMAVGSQTIKTENTKPFVEQIYDQLAGLFGLGVRRPELSRQAEHRLILELSETGTIPNGDGKCSRDCDIQLTEVLKPARLLEKGNYDYLGSDTINTQQIKPQTVVDAEFRLTDDMYSIPKMVAGPKGAKVRPIRAGDERASSNDLQ